MTDPMWLAAHANEITGWRVVASTRTGLRTRIYPYRFDIETEEDVLDGVFPSRQDANDWVYTLKRDRLVMVGKSKWIPMSEVVHITVQPILRTRDDDDEEVDG